MFQLLHIILAKHFAGYNRTNSLKYSKTLGVKVTASCTKKVGVYYLVTRVAESILVLLQVITTQKFCIDPVFV